MSQLHVKRLPFRLSPDSSRTIARFFWVGDERAEKIVARVKRLPDKRVEETLQATLQEFVHRHLDLEELLLAHYEQAAQRCGPPQGWSRSRRLLLGAYFTMEYAFESAALFNPSMVPLPAEPDTAPGSTPFLMSLRAIGEGHVSSIVFRRGAITASGVVYVEPTTPLTKRLATSKQWNPPKTVFRRKLEEMGCQMPTVDAILSQLAEEFTDDELEQAIVRMRGAEPERAGASLGAEFDRTAGEMIWLANASYEIQDISTGEMAQVVLFPTNEAESMGMEDMRLVRFQEDDGSYQYFGTYTAYNGRRIMPLLMKVAQRGISYVVTLLGNCVQNKGLALFPRRVDGKYAMIGRLDGENLFYMRSDQVEIWDEAEMIQEPRYPWDFVQIGNCGSPIETEAGWLLLTHGVGPMRKYCIAATLLDLEDPTRIVGQLSEPLMTPGEEERSGYVPNVVYSCGAMLHGGTLVIPYGISDVATGFATVPLDDLLGELA